MGKRDSRYDPLFEPVKIGPVIAPNRFYQVPHCAGMGYLRPQMMAAMRGIKAEGGWGVVCTEYCSIHPSSDDLPFPHASLWDKGDINNLRLMTDAVHEHGSLAGVELWYGGRSTANLYSRKAPFGPNSLPNTALGGMPVQSQAMSLDDIRELKRWYRDAARRALEAEFDIVYVYANHQYLLNDFLSPAINDRSDEYGGSAINRVRLVREIIEETLETVGHRSAVAVRYSVPAEIESDPDELFEMFESIAELPDLWDITVTDYSLEMGSSSFVKEASNQAAVAKIKSMTTKPLVSVGRFTSPDTMLSQIKNGVQDFIGAARPSIADPFLPSKINQGRVDEIRECIGCNVCYAHDTLGSPIRCTQNPTMGEEWRRGWHPDRVPPKHADETVLVIGAGPAGLEAACTLGKRGYRVTLAEAETELGGRINRESRLPGLSEWARVRDWRLGQINRMPNVEIYPDNRLTSEAVLELEMQHVIVATGANWRSDGVGRWLETPFEGFDAQRVVSVDEILRGEQLDGPVLIYDDDHYYLASAVALKLRAEGMPVTLVTPQGRIAGWSSYTEEQAPLIKMLLDAGVEIYTDLGLRGWNGSEARLACVFTGRETSLSAQYLVPITARLPNDTLWQALSASKEQFVASGGISLNRVGDCKAPGMIASAVYDGHKLARELGQQQQTTEELARDRFVINMGS
ncbi:MAG: NAD(P)-binding protein [Proteobacteria bacterium]|nr:NAD(P)-binding protein [Pseudomonadota bacterium]